MSGCLFLIAVVGAALWLGHGRVAALDLPHAGPAAAVLALTATLAIGSLQGLWLAWRRREESGTEPMELADGTTVRLSGVLQPEGAPLTAPYSGRAAVYLWHGASSPEDTPRESRRVAPRFDGVAAAPCRLKTRTRKLTLRGMPSMPGVAEQQFRGPQHRPAAARLLAATAWTRAPELIELDLHGAVRRFAQGEPSMQLINAHALDRLRMTIAGTTEAELLQRLPAHVWTYCERRPPRARR